MNETTAQKVALVTGGAQRIGAEICRSLHQQGFNIIVHYRHSKSEADKITTALNQKRAQSAVSIQADLTVTSDALRLAQQAMQQWGQVDVLINNASSFYPTVLGSAQETDWDELINSNIKGPFFLTQALIEPLKQRRGCVINLVDIHSEKPLRDYSIYSIAKAGVAMMTKTLAKELAPDVRVNGVSPGAILWPEQTISDQSKRSIINKIPMQKIGEAADIARTVEFLVVDAPYINGEIITVDGGRSLNM
ncbi:pteridine reductase [Oceanicoccus sp. KOV_DT_Chl]|uniref:pteridine reductase n=1 Tax=Oceanicoccus sp. KOV_DT_Chl TaxID=1904639 RepID=UPI000C7CDDFA|nr:pteridine reductase [Oceanicoccus sp. KOV_DT_Chl]